jgi:NADP-dependent aldehyde dehydrogenase
MSEPILIDGLWAPSSAGQTFDAIDPRTAEPLGTYPVSAWGDVDHALEAGLAAYRIVAERDPGVLADFLNSFADRLDDRAGEICDIASAETALPMSPRLRDVEMPRTTRQLREAATAATARSWTRPTLSPDQRIASMLRPIPGVALVFGPNNFPFAFNGISGGDFAAAVASGHPVIAKANPGHPGTTKLLAEEAHAAATEVGLPGAFIQMIYRTDHEVGARLVSDQRVAATAYTGSRVGGLALKAAADAAGKPIYLEMSSTNPQIVLPGAWRERREELAVDLASSMLMGVGQFCTSPGIVLSMLGDETPAFRDAIASTLDAAGAGTLLDTRVQAGLSHAQETWLAAGARIVTQSLEVGQGCSHPNTLMSVDAVTFIEQSSALQLEAFGNMALLVEIQDVALLQACVDVLDASLTGSIYSASDGSDDAAYDAVVVPFSERVGRLLNDRAPTGVAVVAAMNHGGPYPATGHPGFTAVGIPASIERFGMLQCYDNVRPDRMPPEIQPANPLGLVRFVDGVFTDEAVEW